MTRIAIITVLSVSFLSLAACSSGGGQAVGCATSDGFPAPDKEIVWTVAANALREQGFALDREASTKQTWTIKSYWRNSLQPFGGTGYRERAEVTVNDVPNRTNYFTVDTKVIRQPNNNLVQPSNLIAAEWGAEERQPDLEGIINTKIEMYFLPAGPSGDFRDRYGMGQGEELRIPSDEFYGR